MYYNAHMKMKKTVVLAAAFLLAATSFCMAQDDDYRVDPEEKARRAHELAGSDVLYEQENFKALYYQNQRIIELLEELRDEMHSINVRAAQDEKKA
jgi:hypothetical protein